MTLGKTYRPLFTIPPATSRSRNAPRLWPGRSASTTATVLDILKDNNEKYKIFTGPFDLYHNHVAHTILALWALGADEATLKASYESSKAGIVPVPSEPTPADELIITRGNWKEHLGVPGNHHPYFRFFAEEIMTKSTPELLQEYVTTPAANTPLQQGKVGAHMLDRVFDSLIHPMIHVGYGLEFKIPGVLAEGLAQVACRAMTSTSEAEDKGEFASLGLTRGEPKARVDAFSILARLRKAPEFRLSVPAETGTMDVYRSVESQLGGKIKTLLIAQWDLSGPIEKAMEELIWVVCLIYAVGGRESKGNFNADFFLAHFVTSAIFLPSWIENIKNSDEQRAFLRGYYRTCLVWYISRGLPDLDICSFFAESVVEQCKGLAGRVNHWLNITEHALVHDDEHTVKAQRAFLHFAELYGETAKGHFKGTELDGAEEVDGSLFLRAAGLSVVRNEAPKTEADITIPVPQAQTWDFRGFLEKA